MNAIGQDQMALAALRHDHVFDAGNKVAERGSRIVMWITAAMMVVEIAAGWWYNSMALLADGWHMSSHALAIGLSAFAYAAARKYARDPRFAFGTWKIEILAGYTSAVFLLGIALLMAFSSFERLLAPQPIHYREAIVIALVGLLVNIVCAFILGGAHHHGDDDSHGHAHHDLNLRSAYVHVMADAATSVLAVIALVGGWLYGWAWLDPLMGIAGAILVAVWAKNLIVSTGKVLLDREMDAPVVEEIREVIAATAQGHATELVDLHVWRVGKQSYSCALSIVTRDPGLTARQLREQLSVHQEIVHATIEVHLLSAAA
ncbi:CDF family Co(II)/Ni(II) efflux transporter DmeF [Massilia sp. S19_KUP03_FR1]|uniref:CDF family Co(II)/Ni(II) efflux transporter DmeF n=1 Tax=Massilia sp. S19_KUP03_FR1 TaxID=3025503 RepID=UPI002FCD9DE3